MYQLTSTPQYIRVEGMAELVGDIVLTCSGTGATTAPGAQIAYANITVTIPATTITSKVINGAAESVALSEATLIMDDLKDPSYTDPTNFAGVRTHRVCADLDPVGGPGVCTVNAPATPNLSYDGTARRPNIFIGRPNGPNQIVFPGVPLDPPSTSWSRTIRITNIRVNAQAFAPATLLSTISAIIQFQGPASVSVNQISATIAYVQPGMGATKTTVDNSFLQCEYPTDTLAKGDEPATESHGWDTCTASGTEYPSITPVFAADSSTLDLRALTRMCGSAPYLRIPDPIR